MTKQLVTGMAGDPNCGTTKQKQSKKKKENKKNMDVIHCIFEFPPKHLRHFQVMTH